MPEMSIDRPMSNVVSSRKSYSYTYGLNRAYNAEDEADGLPMGFWLESIGFCRKKGGATTEPTEYTEEYLSKQTMLMSRAVAKYTRGLIWVGMIAAGVSLLQWVEIHEGSSDTHILAVSAEHQAVAAATNADIARKNLIASERAWLGPDNASITQLQIGKALLATVTYRNTGREPAPVQVTAQPHFYADSEWGQFYGANEEILASKASCMETTAYEGFIAFPNTSIGSGYTLNVDTQQDPTSQKFLADNPMINGGKVVALLGCMTYKSQDVVHHTSFCFFYKPKFTVNIAALNICQLGWGAD